MNTDFHEVMPIRALTRKADYPTAMPDCDWFMPGARGRRGRVLISGNCCPVNRFHFPFKSQPVRLFIEEDLGQAEAAAGEFLALAFADQGDAFLADFRQIDLPRAFG